MDVEEEPRRRLVPSFDQGTPAGNLVEAIYAEDASKCSSILDAHPELLNCRLNHYADSSYRGPWTNDSSAPASEPPLVMACMMPRYKKTQHGNGPSPGVFSIVQLLIGRGAGLRYPEQVDRPHWAESILHRVCYEYDSPEMLDLLVRAGADPFTCERDESERSLLQVAAEKGAVNSVRFLLSRGARMDVPDLGSLPSMSPTNTSIHSAAEWGRDEVLRVLLEQDGSSSYLNVVRGDGFTPLQLAVGMGWCSIPVQARDREATVNTLLDAGADITVSGRDGMSLLRTVMPWAGDKMVRRLVKDAHADPRERGPHSFKHSPRWWRPPGWSLEGASAVTNLHVAASNWNGDGIRALLSLGAKVGALDSDGRSPLHWVAMSTIAEDDTDVYYYRSWELSPDCQNHMERLSDSAVEPAKVLLLQDAMLLDCQDKFGRSALHYASRSKYIGLVKLLLEHGANPCLKDESDSTPLHVLADLTQAALDGILKRAVDDKEEELLHLLLQAGSTTDGHNLDVNCFDRGGDTPLHKAASCASPTAVDLCLRLGADPNARKQNIDNGPTPLHLAATRPDWQRRWEAWVLWHPFPEGDRRATQMRELLLAAGADPLLTDAEGRTAMEIEKAEAERLRLVKESAEEKARQPVHVIGRGRGTGRGRGVAPSGPTG